ncbi:MerR family transcriptional regulator [Saccharopolyspora gloriosae]|uniref:DNA-binding transcriptional MerR regulator n=1 Tax=Saccharopolyspora gloriosae TaxID=455344 RepID=A0A840NLP3_9PSEU|nr:MerR family transcriptional regulator [Saccharopolyspora gloriosae]MBB5070042.1 DNA-binding transcriptional MerR regulator [Saccharopolyspora gloriosae]
MAWSTREIAELAGTTARTVRHYHQIGLLPEPERRSNGYKQYGVTHLIRLLRIKRLAELGVGLHTIAQLTDDEHPVETLRALDTELSEQMSRLSRARAEVTMMLEEQLATDLPPEFAVTAAVPMSDADRRLTSVLGRLLDRDDRRAYANLVASDARSQVDDDFECFAADAAEAVRHDLAVRMAAHLETLREQHPGVFELGSSDPRRFHCTVEQVSQEIYNPAQLDVLRRTTALFWQGKDRDRPSTSDPGSWASSTGVFGDIRPRHHRAAVGRACSRGWRPRHRRPIKHRLP